VPAGGSSLIATNGGVLLTGQLLTVSGTTFGGAADLGTIRGMSGCALVARGTAPATSQLQNFADGTLIADGVAVDLSALTNLSGTTLVLTNGGTAGTPKVGVIDGANLLVGGGAVLSLPAVTACTEPGVQNSSFHWLASGAGSVLRLANMTNVTSSPYWWSFLQIQATGGGRIELGAVVQMSNAYWGDATYTRGIQVLADGTNSLVDLSSLTQLINPVPAGGSSLIATNGGVLLTGQLLTVSGTTFGGAADLGTIRGMSGCTLVARGTAPTTSQLQNFANGTLIADGVAVDLSALTNLSGTTLVLTNGATASTPNVGVIDGANLLVGGGAVLSLPALTACTEPGVQNSSFHWSVTGANSVLRLSNMTNVTSSPYWWSFLQIQAAAGGRIELGAVVQMSNAYWGDATYTRGIQVLADGTNSVVDLSSLSQLINPVPAGGSSLLATNGGAILDGAVRTLSGTTLTLNASGTISTAQIQTLGDCAIVLDGITRFFPGLVSVGGTSFTAQDGAVLSLTNFPSLLVTNGNLAFTATGPGSRIDLTAVTNVVVAAGGRLDVNAVNGGEIDLGWLESVTGGSVNFAAKGVNSRLDLTRLSAFLTPDGASTLVSQDGGVVPINPGTVFLLANVAVTLPGLITQPSPAMVLQGQAWHSYWVEQRDLSSPASPWTFLARVALTNSLQAFAATPPPQTTFRVAEFIADPPIVDLWRLPDQSAQLVLYGATNRTYSLESSARLGAGALWTSIDSVSMTNAFRVFQPSAMSDPKRFFRARQM